MTWKNLLHMMSYGSWEEGEEQWREGRGSKEKGKEENDRNLTENSPQFFRTVSEKRVHLVNTHMSMTSVRNGSAPSAEHLGPLRKAVLRH